MAALQAVQAMEADQQNNIVAGMEAELVYVLRQSGIDQVHIAALGQAGITKFIPFSTLGGTEARVRAFLNDSIGIASEGLGEVTTALFMDAWITASVRRERRRQAGVDARASNQPRPADHQTHMGLREA